MEILDGLTPELFAEKSMEVLDALSDDVSRAKIPLISNWENFNRLRDMQLVRFRGLVQNMLDPEIYLETYETKSDNNTITMRKGKYRDSLKLEVNSKRFRKIPFFFSHENSFVKIFVFFPLKINDLFSGKRRSGIRFTVKCARRKTSNFHGFHTRSK